MLKRRWRESNSPLVLCSVVRSCLLLLHGSWFLVDNCDFAVVHVDAPGVDHDFDSDSEGWL